MAAGHKSQNSANCRTIEKSLEEGQNTGCLDLSNRKIHEFPKAANGYDLADTVEADISKNRFTEIPTEICEFVLLEKLHCYHNAIKSLPHSIHRMCYLSFLDLSRNQFTSLPTFLCKLTSLEVLIMSNNRLVSVPEDIGELSNLMELDVSDNEVTVLPAQIGELRELKILNVRKNLLLELPPEISKLKLKSLDFSCNKIQAIPLEYRNMESLEELMLHNNPMVDPPAHTCTKGRVHILKYLHNLSVREDKRRGVISDSAFNRNTLRRSYQKEELEAVRMRRKQVLSTDSGYITDTTYRWTTGGAVENGLDTAVKVAESLKEQRAERHLELKSRITGAELRSPGSNAVTPTNPESGDSPSGGISPLRICSGGIDSGEDMFARNGMYPQELQRQKQEYEKKKRRAEQLKAEGASRRSSKPPVPQSTTTPSPQAAATTAAVRSGGRPPQPPVRSASVHSESGIVHGYNSGGVQQQHIAASSPPYYHYNQHRGKEGSHNNGHEVPSGANAHTDNVMEKSTSDSHRSSPISLSSQDGDSRVSLTSSIASSGAAELNSINKTSTLPDTRRKPPADPEQRRPASAALPSPDTAAAADRPRQSNKSLSAASGKTALRLPKSIKSQGRSKTAPLPRTSSGQSAVLIVGSGSISSSSTRLSSQSKPSSTKLPVKAALNSAAGGQPAISISSGAQSKSAAVNNSKFGFQPVNPVNRRSTNSTPAVNGGEQLESHGRSADDDAQHIGNIKQIIESRLKVTLPHDVMGELRDGVVLCHLANFIKPRTVSQIHVKSNAVPKLSMAKCKRNVENFLDACKRLGVPQEQICSQADIIDDKNPGPVLSTVIALKDSKISNKTTQSTSGRPSSRPRSGLNSVQAKASASTSRTTVKSRAPQPLHSVV